MSRHHNRIAPNRTVNVLTVEHGVWTVEAVTVLLVRMTAAQVNDWKWVGEMWDGTDLVEGWEVRDTTGALLGIILPLGHRARQLHAEWYDPTTGEFYAAGQTPDAVFTQGVHYVLNSYERGAGPVPAGEGFALDEPRFLPVRVNCFAGLCPDDCPACAADDYRTEADRVRWAGGDPTYYEEHADACQQEADRLLLTA